MAECFIWLGARPLTTPLNKATSRSNSRLTAHAGKSRSGGNASKQKGNKKPAWTPTNGKPNGKPKMQNLAGEEILLFDSVAPSKDALRVIYAYPNEYTVGITSLGYQLVWAFFETHPAVSVSRLFTDVKDPLPASPDLVGFSFAWELDYSNLLTLLEQMNIPILASDRDDSHPIIFGGGPVLTANPEPYAAFFDCVLLGDGEEMLANFTDKVIEARQQLGPGRAPRERLLEVLAASVPGVYVPQFYKPLYSDSGRNGDSGAGGGDSDQLGDFARMELINGNAPPVVQKQTYRGKDLAASTVVSPKMAWENIFMVEVVRSCPEMCRFCMASYLTLPFRSASLEESLIPTIEKGLEVTDRIGLLGASVTQHPEFNNLLKWLMQPEREHIRLSIASVRTNTVTHELASALASRGTKSLTVAVESGSSRVRRIVNKKLQQEDIIRAAVVAQESGLQALKLYGMVGVPGEEEADVDETIEMMLSIKRAAPRLRLTLGCSTFVPKAHTPFQWYGVRTEAEKRLKKLEKALVKAGITFRPESYKWSVQQAVLSRGDRRLTAALLAARGQGDSLGVFRKAAKEVSDVMPPLEYYWQKNYDPEVPLPWSHLEGPLPLATLRKHLTSLCKLRPSHVGPIQIRAESSDPYLSDSSLDSSEGPLSQANCYGCGVPLQISDTQTPGYVEPEKFALKRRHRQLNQLLCARCQGLSNGEMIPGVADFQQIAQIEKFDVSKKGKPEISSSVDSLRQTGFSAKSLATPEQLRDQLRNVRSSRALIVLLVDLLDASGSMLGRVRDLVGGNPIIVVGTKIDLLPLGTNPDEVEEWLQRALEFKRIATDSVHVVSSKTGDRVAAAVGAVRKARLGRDVYIMGVANVGKSSFVRALVKDMSSMKSRQYDPLAPQRVKHLPVESAMPGTTLRTIPLQVFSSGGTLFDTPGLHVHHRVPHILKPEENKELHPRKRLKAHVPPSPADLGCIPHAAAKERNTESSLNVASYMWGGIGRIDVLSCPPETQLVFYGPAALKVQTLSKTSSMPFFHEEGKETAKIETNGDFSDGFRFGAESVASRGGLRMTREVEMAVDGDYFESIGDIALSGVPGWVSILAGPGRSSRQGRHQKGGPSPGPGVGTVHLKVWAPVGVEVFVRPPLPVSLSEQAIN